MPGGSERCLAALGGFVATGVCLCRGLGTGMAMLASAASYLEARRLSDGEGHGTLHGGRLAAAKKDRQPPSPSTAPEHGHKASVRKAKTASARPDCQ